MINDLSGFLDNLFFLATQLLRDVVQPRMESSRRDLPHMSVPSLWHLSGANATVEGASDKRLSGPVKHSNICLPCAETATFGTRVCCAALSWLCNICRPEMNLGNMKKMVPF